MKTTNPTIPQIKIQNSKFKNSRRSALLRLAFIVNSLADSPSEQELPLQAVHAAAREGRLLQLLAQCPPGNLPASLAGAFIGVKLSKTD